MQLCLWKETLRWNLSWQFWMGLPNVLSVLSHSLSMLSLSVFEPGALSVNQPIAQPSGATAYQPAVIKTETSSESKERSAGNRKDFHHVLESEQTVKTQLHCFDSQKLIPLAGP